MRRFKKTLRKYYSSFAILFLVLVIGLTALSIISPDRDYSTEEKRSLAQFPALSFSTIADGSFMSGLEDWAADQFPFRSQLMQAKTRISLFLGAIRSQDVYRGKDGYLMESFTMPAEEKINDLTDTLANFAARYPDIPKYFCLAPTAISVLEDKLPAAALTDDQDSYIDRMGETFAQWGTFVDVRELFEAQKKNLQLYYRTDHHWTTDGAAVAFSQLYQAMGLSSSSAYAPGAVSHTFAGSLLSSSGFPLEQYDTIYLYRPLENYIYTVTYDMEKRMTASVYAPEYLYSDDPYQIFFGGNFAQITIKTTSDSGRKLLVFKDSYANCLLPFLIPDFSEITVIDPRYYYGDIDMEILGDRYTDMLFLYNANTLSEDSSLAPVLRNEQ